MHEQLLELWKVTPAVVVLLLVLWAGSKGLWHWGPGVNVLIKELKEERDQWRDLALGLLKHFGIEFSRQPPDKDGK